jgi:hypothetical protein
MTTAQDRIMNSASTEGAMAKANLASTSVNALLKLREDIEKVLTSRAQELRDQLARLGHEVGERSPSNKQPGLSYADAKK